MSDRGQLALQHGRLVQELARLGTTLGLEPLDGTATRAEARLQPPLPSFPVSQCQVNGIVLSRSVVPPMLEALKHECHTRLV